MHIILTHEQSDFDALASLFGAHLLDEATIPVLPRRMNRNVRAFINLYGVELPFVDPRDLPNEPVTHVTLVDTQSMISVKGMGPATKVKVIDHHPLREDLPPDWNVTTEEVGATATLLVEVLRDRDSILTPVQATLLLLGIYEDTGSLTYTRTTSRDLHAAAFLLEHGASLQIASDFLNHPLSQQQQALYDRLLANAKTHHVHGYTIVIACGDAQDVDEELSTIAHKMRDALDPDALFILVTTRGGVQLIARSTNDNIDVAQISDYFGGGGHERAAASLIKDRDLESACAELIAILPDFVLPGITVAQIMSRGPQLLTPDTPAEEAASRMRRYGYEGYPVVQDGKVVGLLTRRAVDRALSHKLNLTASSIMDAGGYTVQPRDSIDHLQRLMTETGWGQIPVVHPESGVIIGIVTRTDLLKTLTSGIRQRNQQNLAGRLETALPPTRLALLKAVARTARQQRTALFIVGGFVRDLLLDRPSIDFDLVVEGDAIELARALAQQYGGRVTSHTRFGTAKWHIAPIQVQLAQALSKEQSAGKENTSSSTNHHSLLNTQQTDHSNLRPVVSSFRPEDLPESLDLITARTEFYTHPTALPTVERGSIKLDLHRRDFTINTLALRLDGRHYGELQDYWGGLNDLRHGMVRVLHSLSFIDDPTRMLRAVRFEQRFGFRIESRTLELLLEARSLMDRISGDRLRHELDHIFSEERVCSMLARLQELDLLIAIHPELKWDNWLCEKIEHLQHKTPGSEWNLEGETRGKPLKIKLAYTLWLLRLSSGATMGVIERLKIPRHLASIIQVAHRLWHNLPALANASPSQVVARLEDTPALALYAIYLASAETRLQQIVHEYVTKWQHVSATIDGHQLRARGLPPGPDYSRILTALRTAWLDGQISSVEEEAALLDKLISEQKKGDEGAEKSSL